MKIKRNIMGSEIEIELTSPEMYDAYLEYTKRTRREEVLEYLGDVAIGEIESDRMGPWEAVKTMRCMICDPSMLEKIGESYMRKRDTYPDGEQELNCVVDACNEIMRKER